MNELFDAPSDLIRVIFPNMATNENAQMVGFTSFCPACGGVQLVRAHGADDALLAAASQSPTEPSTPAKKKWWQFWK